MLPPIPTWDGLHPIVVHFPIALLLIVPLLIIALMIFERHSRVLAVIALCLIAIGTVSAFVAEQSGEAAVRNADIPDAASVILEQHEELAELTVKVFLALLVLYAVIALASIFFSKYLPRPVRLIVNIGFLMLYIGGSAMLAKTAHAGGTLVHLYGIRNADSVQNSTASVALMRSPVAMHKDKDD